MYLLDVDTGLLLGNDAGTTCPTISSGSGSGTGCVIIGDVAGNGRKNALQADPTAAGDSGAVAVSKAYSATSTANTGDSTSHSAGVITANLMVDTGQPIYASSALLFVGSDRRVHVLCDRQRPARRAARPGGTGTFKLYGLKDNSPGSRRDDEVRRRSGNGDQFGRPGDRGAAVDVAVGRGRHRVLHDDDARPRRRRARTSARTCMR